MATVFERRDSGGNNTAGMRGLSASRRFDVQLTEGDTDSVSGLLDDINDPITPVAVRFPIGTPHPVDGFSALVVFHWRTVERNARRQDRYIVEVDYVTPLVPVGGGINAWTIDSDAGFETVQIPRALDGRIIGGHAYRPPKQIASDGTLETHTHIAQTIDGPKNLVQIPRVVNPKPQNIQVPVRNIRATNTVPNLTQRQYDLASVFKGKVNNSVFMGEPKGTVLCGPLKFRRRAGKIDGVRQPTRGVVYDLEINFSGKSFPWTPFRLFDTYEFDGFEGEVTDLGGQRVFQDFKEYETANLYGLLNLFGVLSISDKPISTLARSGVGVTPR